MVFAEKFTLMPSAQLTMDEVPDAAFAQERTAVGDVPVAAHGKPKDASRAGASKPRKPRRMLRWLFLSVFIASGAAGGIRYMERAGHFEETDNAFVEADVHPISARVAGTVTEVLVEDNQAVEKGRPLARLDARDFEVKLQGAKTDLEQAVAQVLVAEAALSQARAQQRQADAQYSANDAQLEKARLDFERANQLYRGRDKVISKQEFDTSKAAYDANKGTLSAAQAARDAAAAGVRTAEANHAVAVAKKNHAQAAVNEAELQLSYTTITAPESGRIAKKTVETGQHIQPGQALMAVVAPEQWIVANFKENQLAEMRPGQPVEVTIDALGGRHFHGHIDSFAPGTGAKFSLLPPDNATGNFTKIVQRVPVKILLAPDDLRGLENRIAPGLSAVARVRVKE